MHSLMWNIFINNFLKIVNIQNPIDFPERSYHLDPFPEDEKEKEKFNDSSKGSSSSSQRLLLCSNAISLYKGALRILWPVVHLAKSSICYALQKPYGLIKHLER